MFRLASALRAAARISLVGLPLALASTGCSSGETSSPPASGAAPKPNIILIIADDFGLDKAAFARADPCYGGYEVDRQPVMPNLAQFCKQGARFERAWATPTCSPTRASMLTGQYPFRHGLGGPVGTDNPLPLSATTLPEVLRSTAAGYATANIGKWHLSPGVNDPNLQGWDHYAGSLGGIWPAIANGREP